MGGGGGGGGDIKVNLYPSKKKAAIGMEQIEIGFYLKRVDWRDNTWKVHKGQ